MHHLVDFISREKVNPNDLVFAGDKNPWEVVMNMDEIKSKINIDYFKKAPPYVSKYLPFMPIQNPSRFASMGEGASPLIPSTRIGKELGINLYFKLESQNPTGSFKDRGSAVEMTIAKELGAKAIVVASTGNMAGSCSCYAAHAGIPCFVFVPEDTPASKLAQVMSYGGRIVKTKGNYGQTAKLAKDVAKELGFYLAGDYAYRVEGQKTAAFEVIDQFFYHSPDAVVVPIGCGTNITAYMKGFKEYRELGFIKDIPHICGVVAEGADSVYQSFKKNSREIEALDSINTIATAIGVNDPLDGVKVLDGVYELGGQVDAISDTEMLEAQYMLSRKEGIFVEVSCASSLALLRRPENKEKFQNKTVVCVLTGAGLKDPATVLRIAIKPPTIYPEVDEFMNLYNNSFFEGKTVSFVDKEKIIFDKEPTEEEIHKQLKEHFDANYSAEHVANIKNIISRLLKKGKSISFSDFQDVVQDALETLSKKKEHAFSVEDFEVITWKDKKPQAKVVVNLDGKRSEASAEGTGPVDAVVNALNIACSEKITCSLSNYRVVIRSQGTDAVVVANLKLNKNGVTSVGTGTSPDIIQASIEAFEEAYNGFVS